MSILIKGLIMPSCCDGCTFSDWSNLHQTACCKLHDYDPCFADHSREYEDKRADFCPLVEVSEPHGRLIDEENVKDAIYERLKVLQTHEVFRRKRGDIDLLGVMPYIAKIPTVIEAEGSDDDERFD